MIKLTEKQIIENNKEQIENYKKQYQEFEKSYNEGFCYICGKSLKTLNSEDPCIHSLLRRNKFKKKHMKKVYEKYGYFNISTFLKWCANKEAYIKNINNIKAEKSNNKKISYTIKWKNIEWTFDCSKSDFSGHPGTHSDFPHYHFQMKVDGRIFIKFNDFHVPFSEEDLFIFDNEEKNSQFKKLQGINDFGMQEAIDLIEKEPENLINIDSENAIFNSLTLINAKEKDNPIKGEDIIDIIEESKLTGRLKYSLLKEKYKDKVEMKTIISPTEDIPNITSRTEHNRKSKKKKRKNNGHEDS